MICSNSFAPTSDVGDTRGGADEPIEIESSSDEEVYHIIHVYKGLFTYYVSRERGGSANADYC